MVTEIVKPTNLADLADAIVSVPRCRVVGTSSRVSWCTPFDGSLVSTEALTGIKELRPKDFVATVWAGTPVTELLAELAQHGLTIPLSSSLPNETSQSYGTIGGLVATGLPHALEAAHGPIRDWILGCTVLRGNGVEARSGSSVLKSVAGFDIHRFAVGSRGSLFALAHITLRLFPLPALQTSPVEIVGNGVANWVARLPRSKVALLASKATDLVAVDKETGTLWSSAPLTPEEGWWIGPDGQRSRSALSALESRAKASFDPDHRFAEGWK